MIAWAGVRLGYGGEVNASAASIGPISAAIDGSGTKSTISQLKDFSREIGMDTPAEFRKHAADCETMAKVSTDRETKAEWKRMAERWILCAKLAEDQDVFVRRLIEERSLKAASQAASQLHSSRHAVWSNRPRVKVKLNAADLRRQLAGPRAG
jgi:hypothetical protein